MSACLQLQVAGSQSDKNEEGLSIGAKDCCLLHPNIFLKKIILDVYQRRSNILGLTVPEGDLNPNPHTVQKVIMNIYDRNIPITEWAKFEDEKLKKKITGKEIQQKNNSVGENWCGRQKLEAAGFVGEKMLKIKGVG